MVVPLVMGLSVSILSATTTIFIGAGCFAIGYLIALNSRLDTLKERNDDDDDDDDNSSNRRSILSWVQAMVQKVTPRARIMAVDRTPKQTKHKRPATLQIETLAEILQDFKMVLVVRNDLKMGKGKIAAQCSHATLGLYKKLLNRAPKSLSRWEMCGQVKVVLKIESEEDLLVLQERAKSLNLPTHITIDAGRTQIAPNSRTVMAILGPADVVDDVTGGLKLL